MQLCALNMLQSPIISYILKTFSQEIPGIFQLFTGIFGSGAVVKLKSNRPVVKRVYRQISELQAERDNLVNEVSEVSIGGKQSKAAKEAHPFRLTRADSLMLCSRGCLKTFATQVQLKD